MEELRDFTKDIAVILDDIDKTYTEIKITSSQMRKQDLWRHIEKQQRKLREMRRKHEED